MEPSSAKNASSQSSSLQGKLKIFFGAVPGVGKTLALLEAGRKRVTEGLDVAVGMVDSKGRPEIQSILSAFETIPPSTCFRAGQPMDEFGLDAALERKPDLILLDDLGHLNADGARHKKRWQDVDELLGAGVDVYTTMDVLHLESQKDLVAQITGISVKDSVPDAVFERADEIRFVDATPDELLRRLSEGRITLPEWFERDKEKLFSYGPLLALRELALRKAAERVDDQMRRHRSAEGVRAVWPATERILVCVGPNPRSDRLIRAARRMAKGLRVSWIALHVEASAPIRPSSEDLLRLEEHMRLAERLGAETVSLQGHRAGETILNFARARNVSRIIVGKPTHPRWKDRLFGSLLDEIVRGSERIEVYVITGDAPTETRPSSRSRSPHPMKPWLLSTLSVFGCFALAKLMKPIFAMADLVMVFLLGIVLVAARWGMGPSFLATLLSIALFDFFFVPPFHTFAVSEPGYLITFAVMFLVANVISRLTARVKEQADAARLREQRTAALYGLSRDLVHERSLPAVAAVASRHIGEGLVCRVAVLVPNEAGKLTPQGNPEWDADEMEESRVAEWVFQHRKPAGMGTDTHAHARGLFFPLLATSGPVGVLGLRRDGGRPLSAENLPESARSRPCCIWEKRAVSDFSAPP